MKIYFDSLSARDKRAVLFGTVAIALIMLYLIIGLPLAENWSQVRDELQAYEAKLDMINSRAAGTQAKITGLYQTVPFVESPAVEDIQRKRFTLVDVESDIVHRADMPYHPLQKPSPNRKELAQVSDIEYHSVVGVFHFDFTFDIRNNLLSAVHSQTARLVLHYPR